jgi:DNA-directed RNA polymerase I, II, and III subunit RPABC2
LVVKHSPKKPAASKKPATAKTTKKASTLKRKVSIDKKQKEVQVSTTTAKKSTRPAEEVVIYPEFEYELKEIEAQGHKVLIGPPWLTRFERARITGARSLQLSLGAPPLVKVPEHATSSIVVAVGEIEQKALPISIRRILPSGIYQDIPIDWLK